MKQVIIHSLILISLIVTTSWYDLWWWRHDDLHNVVDVSSHSLLVKEMRSFFSLFDGGILKGLGMILESLSPDANWGRVPHILSIPFMHSNSLPYYLAIRRVNWIWYAITIISVYCIGLLRDNRSCAIIGALIIGTTPFVIGIGRYYGIDFPSLAFVAFSCAILSWSKGFTKVGPSMLFGLLAGITLLIKLQNILFFIGPVSIEWLTRKKHPGVHHRRNIIVSLLLICGISGVWWAPHIFSLAKQLYEMAFFPLYHTNPEALVNTSPRSFSQVISSRWVLYYLASIVVSMGLCYTCAFIVGIICMIRTKARFLAWLLSWLIIPLLLLTCMGVKSERYLLPALPAIALVVGCALALIRQRCIRFLFVTCLAGITILYILAQSHGLFPYLTTHVDQLLSSYKFTDWLMQPAQGDFLASLETLLCKAGFPGSIGLYVDRYSHNAKVMLPLTDIVTLYFYDFQDLSVQVTSMYDVSVAPPFRYRADFYQRLPSYRAIIVMTFMDPSVWISQYPEHPQYITNFPGFIASFIDGMAYIPQTYDFVVQKMNINSFELPDNFLLEHNIYSKSENLWLLLYRPQ